jgi:subtilisin family serine protease
MAKRYAVYLESNPYIDRWESARELFTRVNSFQRLGNDQHEGELEAHGRQIHVKAHKPLGDHADFFLAEIDERDRLELQKSFPMVSIEEDVEARMAMFAPDLIEDGMAAAGPKSTITVAVKDAAGAALDGVDVQLVFERTGAGLAGTTVKTDAAGRAAILFNSARTKAMYLVAQPQHTRWPASIRELALADGDAHELVCPTIDGAAPGDAVETIFPTARRDGQGIRIAIIDGGVGPHKDIAVTRAMNLVPGENDVLDNGIGHGTHVAGLCKRLAPKAEIWSYRVFPSMSAASSAAFVAAGIRQAVLDGAHLINVSITFAKEYPVLRSVLQLAQSKGVVCVCAAGNENGPVLMPARYSTAIAVAACGRTGSWPNNALEHELLRPPATHFNDIHAATFTCFGSEVTVSAPGVGVVSAFPKDRFAVMSGTSMSTPVVCGLIASALSRDPTFAQSAPDVGRATAITRAAIGAATLLGLPPGYEGHGIPFLT